jgi:DNA-binding transcriptional MerR regulator
LTNKASNQPTLVTRKEIAAEFGVHISTVYKWEKEGVLPPAKKNFGRKLYDRQEVIDAFKRGRGLPITTVLEAAKR